MRPARHISAISLAAKAGRVASGEEMTEQALRNGRAHLLLLAEDSSENTKKKLMNMAAYQEIPVRFLRDREELGGAIGKEYRASAAVTDAGFAKMILEAMDRIGKEKDLQDRSSLEENG